MKKYQKNKKECQKEIHGVCEGCGGKLTPIKTVNNSNHPTYWIGCEHCSYFRGGIEKKYFKVARYLVEKDILKPFGHMNKCDYETDPERLSYYYDSQTASLSRTVKHISILLQKVQIGVKL